MDFFASFNIATLITELAFALFKQKIELDLLRVLAISLCVYLIIFLFEGIGLFVAAKKAGIKGKWMAFIPFLNTFLLGRLGGQSQFFSMKVKRAGLYAMLAELVCFACFGAYYYTGYLLSDYLKPVADYYQYVGVPETLQWALNLNEGMYYLISVVDLVYTVFLAIVLIAFFRKYNAKNSMLMAITSVLFPIKAFLIFAVRNNTPVDYDVYMRNRQAEFMRRQQQYYQQTGQQPPYQQNSDRQAQGGDARKSAPQDDPFEEFSQPSSEKHDKKDDSSQDDFFS